MNPGNDTCCSSHEGIKEITYHNTATIPTLAGAWSTYYKDAGYSIPTGTIHTSTGTSFASEITSIPSTSTTPPAQFQSLSLPQSPSTQSSPTSTSKPTPVSKTTTISPGGKAVFGIAGALAAFGAVGLFYLFRRSRTKRRERSRSKPTPDVHLAGRHELMEHDVRGELDTTRRWPLEEAHVGGWNELSGRNGRGKRAEMPG